MIVSAQRAANSCPRCEPACLADRRTSLRRARRVQRAATAEVLALEIYRMDFSPVGEHRRVTVEHHGVRLPGVPQPGDKVGEFIGKVVAFIVRRLAQMAVVLRRTVIAAGDAVPADPPLGHMVERIDEPGEQERRVLGDGKRRDEAKVSRGLREVRHEHGRIELGRAGGIAQIGVVRALKRIRHHRGVLDDEVIEAGTLEPAGEVEEQIGHHPACDIAARPISSPGLRTIALREEPGEVELTLGHRDGSRSCALRGGRAALQHARWLPLVPAPATNGINRRLCDQALWVRSSFSL